MYAPDRAALQDQTAIHDERLRMGHLSLTAELHRLPLTEHRLLIAGSKNYEQFENQDVLANGLLAPMSLLQRRAWVTDLVTTTRQGRQPTVTDLPAEPGSWLRAETRLVDLDGLWFVSLAFEMPRPPRSQGGCVLGIDVGLSPLAVAAGVNTVLSTAPLHLLTGAGLRALERQIAGLRPGMQHEVERRYERLISGAARQALEVFTDQIIARASAVSVEKLTLSGFESDFVERSRERAVADWLQSWLPQRLYAAGIPLRRVAPHHTSLRCHRCGLPGQRLRDRFSCRACGSLNAHENAAHNIRRRGWGGRRWAR
ncbi:zinc ribbon domain-containing protein [Deinococcus budaensis]